MKITGTFLDEISHDIPHQNWGEKEWDRDFAAMKAMGIDTVILIRCGHRRFITYPSEILMKQEKCYCPPVDLVEMFLRLAEKYGFLFYFGTYDSGRYWHNGEYARELELNLQIVEEVQHRYGGAPAFGGWYLNQELSGKINGVIDIYAAVGRRCKELSGNLPVMISPYIDGVKSVSAFENQTRRADGVSVADHEREWDEILQAVRGAVDILAFQDGHCEYDQLADFLKVNKKLADRHGMACWTNCESFDRDMPIKFLPIKWEKLLLKLKAAGEAGMDKAITFEFSHFMSPNSAYLQAGGLYHRYCEYFHLNLNRK